MKKVALVTGGTRGIGAEIAEALQQAGYAVAANYAGNAERAQQFSERTGIQSFAFDVGDFAACERGLALIAQNLGPVDVLVNNAGITRDAMLQKMTPVMWDEVLRTNLTSAFNLSRLVIEGMRARSFGRIINISSVNGQAGQMGQVNYAAAKAGLIGFTKALALENASKGITVNTVSPGYIDTDMVRAVPEAILQKIIARIPVGRLGQAAEIARAVVFLAAEDAGFITGSTLSINGGQYLD